METLSGESAKEAEVRSGILDQRRKTYDACVRKLDKLLEMRLSGEIDEAQFLAKKEELVKEKTCLSNLLKDGDKRIDNWLARAEEAFNFARTARNRFDKGDTVQKREILTVLGTNWTLKDGKVAVSLDEPLKHIAKCAALVRRIDRSDTKARKRAETAQESQPVANNAASTPIVPEYAGNARTGRDSMTIAAENAGTPLGANPSAGKPESLRNNSFPTENATSVRTSPCPVKARFEPKNSATRRREPGESRYNIPNVLPD